VSFAVKESLVVELLKPDGRYQSSVHVGSMRGTQHGWWIWFDVSSALKGVIIDRMVIEHNI
jgi:hypothetical protein